MKSLEKDVADLRYIWGNDITDTSNLDNSYYMEKVVAHGRTAQEVNAIIQEVNALGCVVKDAETGLVDFYHDNNGRLVFLCWHHGEQKVDHWHEIQNGSSTRQHLREMR